MYAQGEHGEHAHTTWSNKEYLNGRMYLDATFALTHVHTMVWRSPCSIVSYFKINAYKSWWVHTCVCTLCLCVFMHVHYICMTMNIIYLFLLCLCTMDPPTLLKRNTPGTYVYSSLNIYNYLEILCQQQSLSHNIYNSLEILCQQQSLSHNII